jgi:hypothetical protein
MKKSELKQLIREAIEDGLNKSAVNEVNDIYNKFLKDPENPKGRAKQLITKFIKQYGTDASRMAVDRFIRDNSLQPEEGYIIKYITRDDVTITSAPGGPNLTILNNKYK